MQAFVRRHSIFLLVALAYGLYAAAFIWRTSFVLDGERYFSLFDDGMISMRYAKNLAGGYGLVWNPGGERVEGFTNLLWVLYMTPFHWLPLAASKVSLPIQISGAVCLLINLFFVNKLAELLSGGKPLASVAALLLTAFYLPLNNWSLQGMEVGAATLIVTLATWLAVRCLEQDRVPWFLYLLLGIGTLLRIDLVVPFGTIVAFLVLVDRGRRVRHVVLGTTTLLVFMGLQTAFRWSYYGDILPNTYYLKMTGFPPQLRIGRGLVVVGDFLLRLSPLVILLAAGIVLTRRDRRMALLLALFCMQLAYSVYVGGDAWEWWGGANRYICIAMPLLFVLVGCGFDYLIAGWQSMSARQTGSSRPADGRQGTLATAAVLGALLVIAANTNALNGIPSWKQWLLVDAPMHVRDNSAVVEKALFVKSITAEGSTVAVVWAGAAPYFMDRDAIDLLGKNDRVIAHEAMHLPTGESARSRYTFFYPGHLKYDYAHSIGKLRPDVVLQVWPDISAAAADLVPAYRAIERGGSTLYLRKDSPNIDWNKVDALPEAVSSASQTE